MTAEIISGKELALKIREHLKQKIEKSGAHPKLAVILAGHDGASEIYVKNKQKAAAEVGIETELFLFEDDVSQNQLENLIDRLNQDKTVNGILLQLPLPEGLDSSALLKRIDYQKDVDGFHPYNIGLLQNGDEAAVVAATPKGVLRMLKETHISLEGKNALVIGRSVIVGKPTSMLLLKENCTVTTAHSHTKNLKEICQRADVVVAACGQPKMIKKDWIKKGAVVIDVGTTRVNGKLYGDVDFDEVSEVASFITPVPGGVGPMTVAMLMKNTVAAAEKHILKEKK